MSSIKILTGPLQGKRFRINQERLVIGRHPGCDIVLESPAVSRQHAEVTQADGEVWLEDLRSRNGTHVNGRPLGGRRGLQDGDEIVVGDVRLEFTTASRSIIGSASGVFADVFETENRDDVIKSEILVQVSALETGAGVHAEARLRAAAGLRRAIGGSLSLDEVLPRLLDGLLEIFPRADRGFVLLPDPQTKRLVLRARSQRGRPESGPLRLSLSLIERVASSRKAILSADAASDSRFSVHESLADFRIRSVMCVPVVSGEGALLGVVQVDSRSISDGFSPADLEVLAGMAGEAAQAIEMALAHDERVAREQINRDLELAHRVQQGLLPSRPPEIPGYQVFDFYEPARLVGGDFFTYVPLAEGRLAVVLADVSGKGVAAALLMAALSADIRYCLASERDLAQAVMRINESFLRGGWDDRFATLVVAVIDPATHRVTICNAGHLPVFVREASGRVRLVADEMGCLPLGMDGTRGYRSCTLDLASGDAFVLCTDGISEALDNDDVCYGLDRLTKVLAGPAQGADEIGRRLLADVERHAAGQVRSDDMCIVCVSRTGRRSGAAQTAQRPGPARRAGRMQAGGRASDTTGR